MTSKTSLITKGWATGIKKMNTGLIFSYLNLAVLNKKIIGSALSDLTVLDPATEGVQKIVINKQKKIDAEYYKFTRFNNAIYWIGSSYFNESTEIFKADNTFTQIESFFKISQSAGYYLTDFSEFNNEIFIYKNQFVFPFYHNLSSNVPVHESLMISDGTPQGTRVLIDTIPKTNSRFRYFTAYKDKFVFKNVDSVLFRESVWISDGTPEGTKRLLSSPLLRTFRVSSSFTEYKNELYFIAVNALWKTN
jgi:hypothetical protein